MPNRAVSVKQFKFLQGVKHGSIKAPGLSAGKASEMLGHQSPKGLPARKGKPKVPKRKHKYPR
jgi:hypothetical protein